MTSFSFGQFINPSFKHISVEDGLSQSVVNSIIQDKQGFLWFATQDGLNKYDGYTFKVFKHDPNDHNSLSHNWIWDIAQDSKQYIWAATWDGLNKYDPTNNRIVRYWSDSNNPNSLSNNRTNIVFCDSKNRLWIGTWGGGLNLYLRDKDHFINFKSDSTNPQSINNNYIRCIFEDSKGFLWIGTRDGGLNKYDPQTNIFTAFTHDANNKSSLNSNYITSIAEDHEGILWIGTYDNGLNRFNPNNNKVDTSLDAKWSFNNNSINVLFTDSQKRIWIGTRNNGLFLFNPKNQNLNHYIDESYNPQSLKGNNIFAIFQDRSSALWFGSTGLNRLDPNSSQFQHINNLTYKEKNISNSNIRCFFRDNQNLWVGTDAGGVNIYSYTQKGFRILKNKQTAEKNISGSSIGSIVKDNNSIYWIATNGQGLIKYNPETLKFKYFINDPKYPDLSIIKEISTLLIDRNGNLWIGTESSGLFKYLAHKDKFEKIELPFLDTFNLTDQYINTLYEDKRGIVWIGHWGGGLSALYPGEKFRIRFHYDPNKNSISNDIVHSICEDGKGAIWIGTASGLDMFVPPENPKDYHKVNIKSFHTKDGLPNEVIYGILKDDNHNLWLSTNKGLSKFNQNQKSFKNYTVQDGLQGDEFNEGAAYKDSKGYMYFGGINGFNIFHPDSISENNYIPQIVITDFRIFNKQVNLPGAQKEITLSYDQNFISFEFAALDYTAPEKNLYAYKMDGLDENWNYTANRRYASYTNLDPGSYTFIVKGSNSDGLWNEEGTSLELYISPPFWRTWWFTLLILIMISAIILALHNFRVKQLLEVEKIRVKIASDLHDDVGSSLTKISMFSDLINEETNPAQNKEMLTRISTMSRELIKTMSDIVWAVDMRKDSFGDLFDRMKEVAYLAMQVKNLQINFDLHNIDLKKELPANVRQNLYLIFKEAVNNIVKHSIATKASVLIKNKGHHLEIIITENGSGIDFKNPSKSGNGLKNMQLRAQRINGKLEMTNDNGFEIKVSHIKI